MFLLTKNKLQSCQDPMERYICRKKFIKSLYKIKITKKLGIIAILLVNTEAQHIVFVI